MKQDEGEFFLEKDELYQQLADTKLRIALLSQQEKETETLLGEEESDTALEEEKKFFADTQDRAVGKIHAQLRKQSIERFARHDLPKIGQVAAAVLLVFYLGLTTAVATVQSVRVSLMKLLYNVEEQYTEISFHPDEDAAFDVPTAWEGNYFMSYLPEGYTLKQCSDKLSFGQEIIYEGLKGQLLRFAEMSLEAETNIDTEGFDVRPVQINGATGLLAENLDTTTIVWSTSDCYFILNMNGSAETAKQVAESVIRIK
ncbi:MAG: DUF4367 domain-containing protein [Acinetobacter sp.]